jgi:mRNA interferase HigB
LSVGAHRYPVRTSRYRASFFEGYLDARRRIKAANWSSTNDLRAATGAVILNGERARFEVAGGNCRMIVAFNFKHQIAFIKFLGTPAESNKIDGLTVSIY